MVSQTKSWITQVDERQDLMNKDMNAIFLAQDRFERHMNEVYTKMLRNTEKSLETKGFAIQNALNDRLQNIEDKLLTEFRNELTENERNIEQMRM